MCEYLEDMESDSDVLLEDEDFDVVVEAVSEVDVGLLCRGMGMM